MDDRISRKDFFMQGFRELGRGFLRLMPEGLLPESPSPETPSPVPPSAIALRPPGAVPESAFLEGCTRCGLCVEACAPGALKIAEEGDPAEIGTPFFPNLSAKPCHLCTAMPCVAACGEGVLLTTPPERVRIGVAVIDPATCFAFRGQHCDYCIDRCPYPEEALFADERGRPVVAPDRCTGCGLCAHICVTTPGSIAIQARWVEELASEARLDVVGDGVGVVESEDRQREIRKGQVADQG